MDSLTQSLLPLRFKPDEESEEVYLISPPTVKQALVLYGLIEYHTESNYKARIQEVMSEWLKGSGLLSYLEKNGIPFDIQILLIKRLLDVCEPEQEEKTEKANKEDGTWNRDESLSLLIAEYRHWFRSDVLNESWPFFLNQLQKLQRLKSQVGFANLAWYAAGKSQESLNALMKSAGYTKQMPELPDEKEVAMQMDNSMLIGQRGYA